MKKKTIIISILVAVLIVGVVLGYLFKTGKIGIGADSAPPNTIYGRLLDDEKKPIANAKISTFTTSKIVTRSTSDIDGNYKVEVPAKERENSRDIYLKYQKDGYDIAQNSKRIDSSSLSNLNLKQDFSLNRGFALRYGISDSSIKADPVCGNMEHLEIKGVIVCQEEEYKDWFNDIPDPIYPTLEEWTNAIVDEVVRLQNLTGVNIPKIVLDNNTNWNAAYSLSKFGLDADDAVATYDESIIFQYGLNRSMKNTIDPKIVIREVIAHEFGHFISIHKGIAIENQTDFAKEICTDYYQKTVCELALSREYLSNFLNLKEAGISGRFSDAANENFAELFANLVIPELNEKIVYTALNVRVMDRDFTQYDFNVEEDDYHTLRILKNSSSLMQNSLIYALKYVIQESKITEFIKNQNFNSINAVITKQYDIEVADEEAIIEELNLTKEYLGSGKYMDKAVVALKLTDHNAKPMENVNLAVSGVPGTTRLKKNEGIFSDGTGDLFNTTGTAVVTSGPIGKQTINITPPIYYPVPFAGQVVDLKPGSNYIELNYQKIQTDIVIRSDLTLSDNQGANVYGKFNTTNGSVEIRSLVKGSIPRYPEEGTLAGRDRSLGGLSELIPILSGSSIPENTFYRLVYLIGGGDEEIFGDGKTTFATETLQKASLAMPNPLFINTRIITKHQKTDPFITYGLLGKACDYVKYPNAAFPNMCF